MSVPRRKPLSTSTGIRPSTASTTSGRLSRVERRLSAALPPWFETTMASAPWSTERFASSAVTIPLITRRMEVSALKRSTKAQSIQPPPISVMSARSIPSYMGFRLK